MTRYDPLKAKAKTGLGVAISLLFGLGLASQLGFADAAFSGLQLQTTAQLSPAEVKPALDLSEAFVNVAKVVTPSVVKLEVTVTRPTDRSAMRLSELFRPQQTVAVSGSGFIVSDDGYVLTNNHVVEGAHEVRVELQDGRSFGATLVGSDPTTDVAVIQIEGDGSDFSALSLGSSDDVRVGEWVLAVGNPGFAASSGSLDYTVTAGIVSALGRPLRLINNDLRQDPRFADNNFSNFAIEDFIQTDAAINRGNSGGPMVNLRGQVIGINSAIYSETGSYQGYGFAIPIDLARRVMEDLVVYGRVRRAYLGISMYPVVEDDAVAYNLPEVAGALIQSVTPQTPAARAGLLIEDVVTAIDGEKVSNTSYLQHKLAFMAPGDMTELTVYRNGSPMNVRVRLGEVPFSEEQVETPPPTVRTSNEIGMEVRDITPRIAQLLQLETLDGVVVDYVEPGGVAYRRGLSKACVIFEVDRQKVRSRNEFVAAMEDVASGDAASLKTRCADGDRVVNILIPQ